MCTTQVLKSLADLERSKDGPVEHGLTQEEFDHSRRTERENVGLCKVSWPTSRERFITGWFLFSFSCFLLFLFLSCYDRGFQSKTNQTGENLYNSCVSHSVPFIGLIRVFPSDKQLRPSLKTWIPMGSHLWAPGLLFGLQAPALNSKTSNTKVEILRIGKFWTKRAD